VNQLGRMSQDDGGSRRRVRLVNFPSTFSTNPDDPIYRKKKHVYKMNTDLDEEYMHRFRLPLLWLLLDYYNNFVKIGKKLVMTESIEKSTQEYFDDQDVVQEWIDSTFERDVENDPDESNWFLSKEEVKALRTSEIKEFIGRGMGALKKVLEADNKLGLMKVKVVISDNIVHRNCWRGWRVKEDGNLPQECFSEF